jgi:hypothetical protein
VDPGIFHDFHHSWIADLKRDLNAGLLPSDHYALAERLANQLPGDESQVYAAKANAIVIRHTSDHRMVAIVEIVSPGNKNSQHGLRAFVDKAVELLRAGIHLTVLDLFPPGSREPQGIHRLIWDEFIDNDFTLPADKPLALVSYAVHPWPEAFIEPVAIGDELVEMPLFLAPDIYIPAPLAASYNSAWKAVPSYWRDVVSGRFEHR